MRTISSTRSALPCTSDRQDGTATFTTGPVPATMKPRWPRMRFISGKRHLDAGEALHLGRAENRSTRSSPKALPTTMFSDGVPPQNSITSWVAMLQPRHHEGRIDAALEPIARIRIDAELAAGLGDVDLVPQRRFDQHVGGCSEQPEASPPMMPASDSTPCSSAITHTVLSSV